MPRRASRARSGALKLELRLIADVGLVGLPNAGKSTLLAALTAATPQVASYPFTTLEPNLGVLDLSVVDPRDERRVTVADMPGLIEGASGGAGLGHEFLRHVARTRVLVHVVDLAAAEPEKDYQVIRDELEAHDPSLLDKVTLVVGNKIDLPAGKENQAAFGRVRKKEGKEFIAALGGGSGLASTSSRPSWRASCPTPRRSRSPENRLAWSCTASNRAWTSSRCRGRTPRSG